MDWMSFGFGILLMAVVAGIGIFLQWRNWSAAKEAREAEFNRQQQELQGQLAQEKARAANFEGQLGELSRLRDERAAALEQLDSQRQETTTLLGKHRALETQIQEREKAFQEQRDLLASTEAKLREAFENLAQDAVQKSQTAFLELAYTKYTELHKDQVKDLEERKVSIETLIKPLQEKLGDLKEVNQAIEKERTGAYAALRNQLEQMQTESLRLQRETRNLVDALKNPTRRGQWGELQLRRVVEMAGMVRYCDFEEQVSVQTETGRLRPDVVVKLPNERRIVIDAKAPLEAYTQAMETEDDEQRKALLQNHARQVRQHATSLGQKGYQEQFDQTPEFVVMFIPGDPIFTAALEQDPSLIEFGVENRVLFATPTTLIALMKAVEAGWRSERLQKNARTIFDLGIELHNRMSILSDHIASIGVNLEKSVNSYNSAVSSLERNVYPQARKLGELAGKGGEKSKKIASKDEIASTTRSVKAFPNPPIELSAVTLPMFEDEESDLSHEATEDSSE